MKKLFFSTVLTVLIAASSFAANINNENHKAIRHFALEYKHVNNVKWTTTKDFTKATFTIDNKIKEVFYDQEGNVIGTSSPIELNNLPVSAKRHFAKKYAGFTVKEAIEFFDNENVSYFLSAENDTQSLILKISAEGFVTIYKNLKK